MANKQANNKKDKKKDNSKQDERKQEKTGFLTFGKLFGVSALMVAGMAIYIYHVLMTPPQMPNIDFNEYWGTYPMVPKPDLSIRPFKIEFTDVVVNDLRERLLHRRPFAPPLEEAGFTYGFNSHFLTRVLDYWQNKYDFKQREDFFNKYNHYITNIQGLDIHYMHVRPDVTSDIKIIPLLLLHGWPGSIREFYEIIPKLINPRPQYDFVFEIIAPSLPGFGFSQATNRPGMSPTAMAVVISNLMKRIGFDLYYVQGGDLGHSIGSILATIVPYNVLGFHTNMPSVFHPLGSIYTFFGALWPSLVVQPELENRLYPLSTHLSWHLEETGYLHIQATKPDTIGAALTDSPSGLAAYILEKFSTWTNPDYKKSGDGNLLDKFVLTHLLDNVMVYWVTNSITTSMRVYAEGMCRKHLNPNIDLIPTNVPTWGITFKHDITFSPDCNLKLKYKNYLHTTAVYEGGHFAAMENPEILANDIFDAVNTFIIFHASGSKIKETPQANHATAKTIYDFTAKDIRGNDIKLSKYKGHVLLIVNVASQCGLTDKNYHQLNELHEKYANRGLKILAFPCNQFGGQEPGTFTDIINFTKEKGVQFDLFEKIEVNGDNAHPLWKFLKKTQSGTLGDFIKWNFSKFIVDRNGIPVERLGPNVDPINLEPYLAKYW